MPLQAFVPCLRHSCAVRPPPALGPTLAETLHWAGCGTVAQAVPSAAAAGACRAAQSQAVRYATKLPKPIMGMHLVAPPFAGCSGLRRSFVTCRAQPSKGIPSRGALGDLLGGVRCWGFVNGVKRLRFKMKKHRYLKSVKKVRYISVIPQYTGPLGRQNKKRPIIRDYRKTPRLRIFKRER